MSSVIDNKKILKNTVFLYCRMFFIMIISLYTVRIVLRELGVVDYGIYNVVGSVVSLCTFLTGTLTAASNRFFSMEMVKEDKSSLNKCFCLNITVFSVLMLGAIVLLETVGLCYVNTKMVIPSDRLLAANVVYQLSVLSLCSSFVSIPYNSLLITHQRMSVYAYIGIAEALLKLLIAWALLVVSYDKLIFYAALTTVANILVTLIYYRYCRSHYEESKFHFYWNREEFNGIFKFISLYFFGSISAVIRPSGMNLLINAFFSPAINAARAIAFQVESAVMRFSDGYFSASRPQLYMAYANKEFNGLNHLIIRITIISLFLMTLFVVPLSFNADYVLTLWLGEVPAKAVVFMQLVLIDSAINASSQPVILTILATGKQLAYQISEFVLRCVTLPIAYIFLLTGGEPESTAMVCIALSLVSVFMRIYFLKRQMPEFNVFRYVFTLFRIVAATVLVVLAVYAVPNISSRFVYLLVSTVVSSVVLAGALYLIALSPHDREYVHNLIMTKLFARVTHKKLNL